MIKLLNWKKNVIQSKRVFLAAQTIAAKRAGLGEELFSFILRSCKKLCPAIFDYPPGFLRDGCTVLI